MRYKFKVRGKLKNLFKKVEDLTKKIRNDRKKIFNDLTKLQNILRQQKFIRSYCNYNQYRTILGNNLISEICKVSSIIDTMSESVYRERVRIARDIGILDKELNKYVKIYDEASLQNRKDIIKELEEQKSIVVEELNSEVQEEGLLKDIINLHNEKEKLVNNLIIIIRNNAVKKDFNELNKLIKNEKRIINELNKYMKENEKNLKNERGSINQTEHII